MALCDDLEARQAKKRETAVRLNRAALDALTTAEGPEEVAASFRRVTENFEVLVDAPDGVKKLRDVILNLAMRGRLVRSDPKDEAVSSLLVRLGQGYLSKEHRSSAALDQEPYKLNDGWSWCRFVDVASIESCLVDPSKFLNMPHVAPDNIEKGTGRLLAYNTIGQDGVFSSKHRFYPGQILYSKIRPNLSKVVVVDFEGLCSADMYPVAAKIDTRFLHLFMLSPEFLRQVVRDDNRLAMPKVNQQQLSETVIAVPPLAEQKRIVAKVDQLMALCDSLEVALRRAEGTAQKLAEAVVAEIVA
jgi:type I restriction enzyme S subunit